MQGAAGGGLQGHPGELEPRDHHDRSGDGRRHLHRADHLAGRRDDHRERAARCAAADDGRADRPQLRARPRQARGAREVSDRADRREPRGNRQGGGPRAVQARDETHRPRVPALRPRALDGGGAADPGGDRLPGRPPAVVHAGRLGWRHRLQPRGVHRHLRARSRRLADARAPDRGVGRRLEGVRDGGGPRPARQLHHRVRDREPRPDGRAHRRLDHGRAGADPHRQGVSAAAGRLDRGAPRGRRRHRRVKRPVRGQPRRRPDPGHRDEPARQPLLRARVEGDRLSDRQDRGEARRRLHPR